MMSVKTKLIVLILGATATTLIIMWTTITSRMPTEPSSPSLTLQQITVIQSSTSPENSTLRGQRSYLSLSGRFSLNLFQYDSGCRYTVTDQGGNNYDVAKLFGTNTTNGCDLEWGSDFWHYFGGWGDRELLIMPGQSGEIHIINVEKLTFETYHYDANQYVFNGVSRSLQYWLFRKKAGAYVLFNGNEEDALPGFDCGCNWHALYDAPNDGFVFTSRPSYTTAKIFFLSLSNLSYMEILATEPAPERDIGCEAEKLHSKPGEIVLSPG